MTSPKLSATVDFARYTIGHSGPDADKLYLVIELVRLDTKPRRVSTAPVPADGAGGPAVR